MPVFEAPSVGRVSGLGLEVVGRAFGLLSLETARLFPMSDEQRDNLQAQIWTAQAEGAGAVVELAQVLGIVAGPDELLAEMEAEAELEVIFNFLQLDKPKPLLTMPPMWARDP